MLLSRIHGSGAVGDVHRNMLLLTLFRLCLMNTVNV